MSIESHAIPSGQPVGSLLHDSLAARFAARPAPTVELARPAHQPRPASETLDAGQCRIWLNECRREIDRLRMGLDVRPELVSLDSKHPTHGLESAGVGERDGGRRETLADPPMEPKLYAVPPLSEMPERRAGEPVELPPRVHVLNHYHVTNLGTLLDVLA